MGSGAALASIIRRSSAPNTRTSKRGCTVRHSASARSMTSLPIMKILVLHVDQLADDAAGNLAVTAQAGGSGGRCDQPYGGIEALAAHRDVGKAGLMVSAQVDAQDPAAGQLAHEPADAVGGGVEIDTPGAA